MTGPLFAAGTVVVTGAARGLGACMARAFAREGAFVLVNYRLKERPARAVVDEIRAEGGEADLLPCDVRDRAAVAAALDEVAERRGAIDVLVNNAGVVHDAYFAAMEPEQWRRVVDTNLEGVYNCTRAVAPRMLASGSGAIVNVVSVAALRASPGQANYAAAKGAVLSFTRTVAAELAPRGVRVNAVVPGLIHAGMTVRANRGAIEEKMSLVPMGRMGTPEEVAAVVLFLASHRASYITGAFWAVDGGLTA